jgi:hypothetical protein
MRLPEEYQLVRQRGLRGDPHERLLNHEMVILYLIMLHLPSNWNHNSSNL